MAQASAEKREHTGPANKEKVATVPHREQLVSTPEQSFPRKRNRAVSPEYQIVRGEKVKVSESRISATQNLWLRDRKVGSQVIGEDQSQLPGRGIIGEVWREGR